MAPAEGQLVAGKYRLLRPLARGGMGTVWIARHEELDVEIALKFMAEELLELEAGLTRFRREARAAARLKSAHVTQIHDYGVHEGRPYIAMELLEGEDLNQRLARRGRLDLAETAAIVQQIGIGLARAHEEGIVHRDLKPANVYLAESGSERTVKILDFGIAKLLDGAAPTATGVRIGSPRYMSPEQIRGETVDHRTDLWALGVVIYEMLTGREPFRAEHTAAIFEAICRDDPPPPSRLVPELGSEVDAFVARALSRARALRFQSAGELSDALSAIARGEPLPRSRATRPAEHTATMSADDTPPEARVRCEDTHAGVGLAPAVVPARRRLALAGAAVVVLGASAWALLATAPPAERPAEPAAPASAEAEPSAPASAEPSAPAPSAAATSTPAAASATASAAPPRAPLRAAPPPSAAPAVSSTPHPLFGLPRP